MEKEKEKEKRQGWGLVEEGEEETHLAKEKRMSASITALDVLMVD